MLTLCPEDTAASSQIIESIWWEVPGEYGTKYDADVPGMLHAVLLYRGSAAFAPSSRNITIHVEKQIIKQLRTIVEQSFHSSIPSRGYDLNPSVPEK